MASDDDKPKKEKQPATTEKTVADSSKAGQQAPADALSRTPEDLEQEQTPSADQTGAAVEADQKKLSGVKKFFRKVNVYFLLFLLLIVVAGAISIVNYLNSQGPAKPSIADQALTAEELKQLRNADVSVGDTSQTLTIKGDAVVNGQLLARGNLGVAGTLTTGGEIQGPSLTISGKTNLNDAQVNGLQVAKTVAVQGNTTLQGGLSVAGAATFNSPITASQMTVSKLIMSGNASLQIPGHINFTGPSPGRSINPGVLGNGGSASVSGSDTAGTVTINTGVNPSAGCFVNINFRQGFSSQPHVLISPVGAAAGRTQYYTERDTGSFSICASSPAPANQSLRFDYFVMG